MNIEASLLQEHSKARCNKITAYIGNNKERFAELMRIFFECEYRLTQRAAWPMSYCVRNHPELIAPYFKKIIDKLSHRNEPAAVTRNIVRLLQDVDVPKKYHGKLMTTCFNFLQSNETPVAIKAFSMTILQNLSSQYPDIIHEVKTIIEKRWPFESAAFRSRARNFLKSVKRES
jgi:hypothetical protein